MFKEKPMDTTISINNKNQDKAQTIYWFERADKSTFCCDEKEAWNIMKGRIKVMVNGSMEKRRHTYLGASDGTLYFSRLDDIKAKFKENGLEASQEAIRQAEEDECAKAQKGIVPRDMDTMGTPAALKEMGR